LSLRGFWDAIVRQIKKMWAAVKNWYLKVLDAAPRMKSRAEALAKKSSNITGQADSKSFDMGGVTQLSLKGKAPDPSDALKVMKLLAKGADSSLGDKTSGSYENTFESYEKVLDSVDKLTDTNVKGVESVSKFYEAGAVKEESKSVASSADKLTMNVAAGFDITKGVDGGSKRFGDDVEVKGTAELFGGRQIVTLKYKKKAGDEGFSLVRLARSSGVRFVDSKEKPKDVESTGTWKTLSSSDIRSLMDELSDICDHIMTYKKAWENRDKQFNKMDTAAKKAVENADKDKDASRMRVRIVKDVALGMSSLYQLGIRFENQLIQYLLAVGRTTITWVERSLSQYKSA
jgi:hypothetical protein